MICTLYFDPLPINNIQRCVSVSYFHDENLRPKSDPYSIQDKHNAEKTNQ